MDRESSYSTTITFHPFSSRYVAALNPDMSSSNNNRIPHHFSSLFLTFSFPFFLFSFLSLFLSFFFHLLPLLPPRRRRKMKKKENHPRSSSFSSSSFSFFLLHQSPCPPSINLCGSWPRQCHHIDQVIDRSAH